MINNPEKDIPNCRFHKENACSEGEIALHEAGVCVSLFFSSRWLQQQSLGAQLTWKLFLDQICGNRVTPP